MAQARTATAVRAARTTAAHSAHTTSQQRTSKDQAGEAYATYMYGTTTSAMVLMGERFLSACKRAEGACGSGSRRPPKTATIVAARRSEELHSALQPLTAFFAIKAVK
jgi:hypothetical protein